MGVDYNIGFLSPLCNISFGVKRQGQIYLQSVYGLLRELLHCLTNGIYT